MAPWRAYWVPVLLSPLQTGTGPGSQGHQLRCERAGKDRHRRENGYVVSDYSKQRVMSSWEQYSFVGLWNEYSNSLTYVVWHLKYTINALNQLKFKSMRYGTKWPCDISRNEDSLIKVIFIKECIPWQFNNYFDSLVNNLKRIESF